MPLMPTAHKKVIFYAPPDIERWLAEQSAITGAPVGELCRRAIRLAACADAQSGVDKSLLTVQRPPVLFTPKQESR